MEANLHDPTFVSQYLTILNLEFFLQISLFSAVSKKVKTIKVKCVLVSFAAIFRLVTQRSPLGETKCVPERAITGMNDL